MKIYLTHHKSATNLYTIAALRHMCCLAGIQVVNHIRRADAIWVSMCDPCDLPVLVDAKTKSNGRPVIMGGFEAFFGDPYLAWADCVVVGEAWDFVREWAKSPTEAMDLDCVLTKDKAASASYNVNYGAMPLLKVPGRDRYYYLAGRGCRNKCKFCATSWCNPQTHNPNVSKIVSMLERRDNAKLTLITNDSSEVLRSRVVNAQSVTVKQYISDPDRYKASMLHFGIEGWTEQHRKALSKPIPDNDIRELLDATKRMKQRCELFFIVDYPGWSIDNVLDFAENVLPIDPNGSPAIQIKTTYFDPCPHTPLARSSISCQYCDTKLIFREMNSRNKRIRVFPTRSRARSAWRTVLHRCSPDDAVILGKEPTDTNCKSSFAEFGNKLNMIGLAHLIGEQKNDPCSRVAVRCK